MAVEWLRFTMRGHGGEAPTGTRFFEVVGLKPADGFETLPSDSAWKSARIVLLEVLIEQCQSGTERYEEFAVLIASGLARVAEWLSTREPAAFESWRNRGNKADVFIRGWMNSDQFDLTLPSEFLLACGNLGLPIVICTND